MFYEIFSIVTIFIYFLKRAVSLKNFASTFFHKNTLCENIYYNNFDFIIDSFPLLTSSFVFSIFSMSFPFRVIPAKLVPAKAGEAGIHMRGQSPLPRGPVGIYAENFILFRFPIKTFGNDGFSHPIGAIIYAKLLHSP